MKKISLGLLITVAALSANTLIAPIAFATPNPQQAEQSIQAHQVQFSQQSFKQAQQSGQPFLIAFHKKGCSTCVSQQQALNKVYQNPQFQSLKVLMVDYDNDINSLRQFNVGQQGTLILYKGDKEVNRTAGLTKAQAIAQQIQG